jgi:hypothetical protein
MTLKDILENGYGIDFSTIDFKTLPNVDACTKEEIIKSMENDEIIVDGEWINDFDIVPDTPNGYVELYWD